MTVIARKVTIASLVVLAGSVVFVASRAESAPRPDVGRRATVGEARYFAGSVATDEPHWRNKSVESFPGDLWSQRDDFHAQERDRVKDLSEKQKIPVEQVLRAVDEDVRASARRPGVVGDPRGARAVPCKPRPVYD